MVDAAYTDLESVRRSYLGAWSDEWDEKVEEWIPIVSSILRSTFKRHGRSLDASIILGDPELIIVRYVANQMISRRLSSMATASGASGVDYKNLSVGVGPYSMAITPVNTGKGFMVQWDEKERLGLNSVIFSSFKESYFSEDGDEVVPN